MAESKTTPDQKEPIDKGDFNITHVEAGEITEFNPKDNSFNRLITIHFAKVPSNNELLVNDLKLSIKDRKQQFILKGTIANGQWVDLRFQSTLNKEHKQVFTKVFKAPLLAASNRMSDSTSNIAVLVFYMIIAVALYFSIDGFKNWINSNLLPITLVGSILVIVLVYGWIQKSSLKSSIQAQIRFIFAVVIPVLILLSVSIYFIPSTYHVSIFRIAFLLVVIFMPLILYFMFISSRKSSLLQAYFSNLSRLGLLGYGIEDDSSLSEKAKEVAREIRVMSFIQKFELMYGNIPTDLADEIIATSDPNNPDPSVPHFHNYFVNKSLGDVFTWEATVPVIIATLLIALGWVLVLPPWAPTEGGDLFDRLSMVFKPTQIAVLFAFLGAYFFSIQMLFRRYIRKDLRSNAYISVILRIILSVIGTWAVIAALKVFNPAWIENDPSGSIALDSIAGMSHAIIDSTDTASSLALMTSDSTDTTAVALNTLIEDSLPLTKAEDSTGQATAPADAPTKQPIPYDPNMIIVIGFVIGVFPPIAWQIIVAAFTWITRARFFVPSLKTSMPIRELDGLTIWHEARFEEEDVENVPNMATANMVDLMLNTRYPAGRIVDWVDQAILYTQIGFERKKKSGDGESNATLRDQLRKKGIRTASALIETYNKLKQEEDPSELSILNEESKSLVFNLIVGIENNPNIKLIINWKGLSTEEETPSDLPYKQVLIRLKDVLDKALKDLG